MDFGRSAAGMRYVPEGNLQLVVGEGFGELAVDAAQLVLEIDLLPYAGTGSGALSDVDRKRTCSAEVVGRDLVSLSEPYWLQVAG